MPTSIIDNQGDNTLYQALQDITETGHELWIATAFFSLDALNMMGERLDRCHNVRLLFGDDAAPTQRAKLLQAMRERSDADLLKRRETDPLLKGLRHAKKLIEEKRLESRVYTKDKFHAKAYLAFVPGFQEMHGILGSGNFTRPGLTQNIELNVHLTPEQTGQLQTWYEGAWEVAHGDEITALLYRELERQLHLYDPYVLYQRALIAWGKHFQGNIADTARLDIMEQLDPHQLLGYRRAVEILERENGVLICDGVGLGKSFIALALMEHYCRLKKNVLLIAPKSIMAASWSHYLETYLEEYRQPYGTIDEKIMTDLSFDPEDEELGPAKLKKKIKEFKKLAERVDVIVVDESHNFRTTNVQRYLNLKQITAAVSDDPAKRKLVILLTATPINTKYQDLSAQLALIAQDRSTLVGYEAPRITAAAKDLDKVKPDHHGGAPVLDLDWDEFGHNEVLRRIMESIVIQRKRSTCIALAKASGKDLIFPIRKAPETPEYQLSESWKEVVRLAEKRFDPIANALKKMKAEYKKAEEMGIPLKPYELPKRSEGIRFAAFLPEQYRVSGGIKRKNYQVEVFLAGLVFTNIMKQLESSPAAFQGIVQSLGTSLVARLRYVFGEKADGDIAPHMQWITAQIQHDPREMEDEGESDEQEVADGESLDQNGEELEAWLNQAMSARHLHKKLAEFNDPVFDVQRWRRDILHDLKHLQQIHEETLAARRQLDFKLELAAKNMAERLDRGERVVVFTQSQRTSHYLEKELQAKLRDAHVARIDSNVKDETRKDILHAFCPNYNPAPTRKNRDRVDVLISTDVLSEGVNMQEAHCILNYDIHWNPVRLIQRIGRVDRRLDPAKTPEVHAFSIVNFLPPKEINEIIRLVDTVENRTTRISKTLGIDQAFFKSTDPAGTLKEFNTMIDGEPTKLDRANERFVEAIAQPDKELQAQVEQLPLGAFGVWKGAPTSGVFALFEMQGTEKLSKQDAQHFKGIIGTPVLVLKHDVGMTTDAPEILEILGGTVKGERSGDPSDEAGLQDTLRAMKNKVNQMFRDVNLVVTIQPKLVCWMELKK